MAVVMRALLSEIRPRPEAALRALEVRRRDDGGPQGPAAAGLLGDLGDLCHELRTPMNAILGYVELLLDGSAGPLAAPAREYCGQIQDAARCFEHLTDGLLLIGELRASGPMAADDQVDLAALISTAVAAHGFGRPPVEAAAGLRVRTDAARLRRFAEVLGALLVEAGGEQRPILLAVEPRSDGGAVLRIQGPPSLGGEDGHGAIARALVASCMAVHGGSARRGVGHSLELRWPRERVVATA